jgi:hypothetical protein
VWRKGDLQWLKRVQRVKGSAAVTEREAA